MPATPARIPSVSQIRKPQEERVPDMAEVRERFPEGTRVRTRGSVERYPHFTVPAGATGTVIDVIPDAVAVKMDRHIPGCEDWSNEVVWQIEDLLYHDLSDDLEVIAPQDDHQRALDAIDYVAYMGDVATDSWTLVIEPDPTDRRWATVACDSRQQAEQCIRIVEAEGGRVHVSLNKLSGAALIADHVQDAESAAGWDPNP